MPHVEPRASLLCSKKLNIDSVLRQINPVHTFPPCLFKIHFNIILLSTPISHKCFHFIPSWLKFHIHFWFVPWVLHSPNISSSLIDHHINIWHNKLRRYSCNLYILLWFPACWARTLQWALCSRTPSLCVLFLGWETKFRTCTTQQVISIVSCTGILILTFLDLKVYK
jgi:hypothetical protein